MNRKIKVDCSKIPDKIVALYNNLKIEHSEELGRLKRHANAPLWWFLFVIPILFAGPITRKRNERLEEFTKYFKENIITKFVQKVNPNLQYTPESTIQYHDANENSPNMFHRRQLKKMQEITNHKYHPLTKLHNQAQFTNKLPTAEYLNDFITGTVNGTSIECCNMHLKKITRRFRTRMIHVNHAGRRIRRSQQFQRDRRGNRIHRNVRRHNVEHEIAPQVENIFRGFFVHTELNNSLDGHLKISKPRFSLFRPRNRITVDCNEFKKHFALSGSDQVLTNELLTPQIMATLVNFKTHLNVQFEAYIEKTTLLIRLHTGPLFEPCRSGCPINKNKLLAYYAILRFALDFSQAIDNRLGGGK